MVGCERKAAKQWILIAALISAATLTTTAPALADDTDDAFLAALEAGGINIKNPNAAIAMGKTVCAGLDKGMKFSQVVQTLMINADLSPTEAGHALGVSVAAYCPQYRDDLQRYGG